MLLVIVRIVRYWKMSRPTLERLVLVVKDQRHLFLFPRNDWRTGDHCNGAIGSFGSRLCVRHGGLCVIICD